jgi:hypothetical protein
MQIFPARIAMSRGIKSQDVKFVFPQVADEIPPAKTIAFPPVYQKYGCTRPFPMIGLYLMPLNELLFLFCLVQKGCLVWKYLAFPHLAKGIECLFRRQGFGEIGQSVKIGPIEKGQVLFEQFLHLFKVTFSNLLF